VLAGSRVHGDDTTVPVLAKGRTTTGRAWVYVRDDRPFGGPDPPAAVFHYSRDRTGEHPERHLDGYTGILQADAYAGFNRLYDTNRRPGPLIEAACWSHARRKFFELADIAAKARGKLTVIAPLALEAVKRIDAIFAIEREINGVAAAQRVAIRHERSVPLVRDLEDWMCTERARLSRHADVAKAMDYMLKRWAAFTRFLDDGRICLTNNAAERALRGIALGRKAWLFAGSDRGGERAALMYTLIQTARLNGVDRKHGSTMCSPASMSAKSAISIGFSRGTGSPGRFSKPPPNLASSSGPSRLVRGARRMLTSLATIKSL